MDRVHTSSKDEGFVSCWYAAGHKAQGIVVRKGLDVAQPAEIEVTRPPLA
jgi:hypothetical protein